MSAVYVVGSGGIALFLQYLLQESTGSHLVLRERSLARLQGQDLRVTGSLEGTLALRTHAWDALPALGPRDTLFLAMGAHDVTPALETLRGRLDPATTIVLCQNAIGMHARASQLLERRRLLRMHCWLGSNKRAPNHIHLLGIFKLDLSGAPEDEALLGTWRQTFESCGIQATTGLDVPLAEWTKALWTIGLHAICAIADAPIGVVQQSTAMEALARRLMNEAQEIAALDGVILAQEDIDDVIEWVAAAPDLRNATLRDLEAGRPHDLVHFNGAVVVAAARHGARAPYNEMALHLINEIQRDGQRRSQP